jgi:hypothetical protein
MCEEVDKAKTSSSEYTTDDEWEEEQKKVKANWEKERVSFKGLKVLLKYRKVYAYIMYRGVFCLPFRSDFSYDHFDRRTRTSFIYCCNYCGVCIKSGRH